jgi:hypothetical protein
MTNKIHMLNKQRLLVMMQLMEILVILIMLLCLPVYQAILTDNCKTCKSCNKTLCLARGFMIDLLTILCGSALLLCIIALIYRIENDNNSTDHNDNDHNDEEKLKSFLQTEENTGFFVFCGLRIFTYSSNMYDYFVKKNGRRLNTRYQLTDMI